MKIILRHSFNYIDRKKYGKRGILRVFPSQTYRKGPNTHVFEGGTTLNKPSIEIHAKRPLFETVFLPHVTDMQVSFLDDCLGKGFNFILNLMFHNISRSTFPLRASEQRPHSFQPVLPLPHRFRLRYQSDSLSLVRIPYGRFLSTLAMLRFYSIVLIKINNILFYLLPLGR